MIVILFSILLAALGIAYLQLKYSMSHGPTSKYLHALKESRDAQRRGCEHTL